MIGCFHVCITVVEIMKLTRKQKNSIDKVRGLIPGYDPKVDAKGCKFDYAAASIVLDFFHEHVKHVKGPLAGQLFELEDWQKAILVNLFGWKTKYGTRRYRELWLYIPRKNGKTALMAGVILYVLMCDNEEGAELYSAAADKEQALLVFQQAEGMVAKNPEFRDRIQIYTALKSMVFRAGDYTNSYKAISAEAKSKHGFNSHCFVVDEVHAQPDGELIDVLETSTGARTQPLKLYITTADYDRPSICNEKLEEARSIRDGTTSDPTVLPVIYEATKEDDWEDPKVWKRVNPNLGVSISKEYFETQFRKAKRNVRYENTFKRLHLNIQTQQDMRWISLTDWDSCVGTFHWKQIEENQLGKTCYAGLDCSSVNDFSALVYYFPETHVLLPRLYLTEDSWKIRESKNKDMYHKWRREGAITITNGNVVDQDHIKRDIVHGSKLFQMREIAVDRWNSLKLSTELVNLGIEVVLFGQDFASMSPACKEFERLVLNHKMQHGDHPVMRWMAGNVAVEEDKQENIRPVKQKATEKVDGIVAAIMGIGRAIVHPEDENISVYETRGVLVV